MVHVEGSSSSSLTSSNLRLGTFTTNQSVSYERIVLNPFDMFSILMKVNTQLTLSNICFKKDKSYLIFKVMHTYMSSMVKIKKKTLSGLEESV